MFPKLFLSCVLLVSFIAGPALAEDKKKSEDVWSDWYVSAGLQMWRPVFVTDQGGDKGLAIDAGDKAVIGGVVKLHTHFNDKIGMHVRGNYGVHSHDYGKDKTSEGDAWTVGLGVDFYHALSTRILWSNTFGVAYGQTNGKINDNDGPTLNTVGAYFITTLDVTLMGPMGIWMDWGCQVVGPSFATYKGEDLSIWHINPMGAGGMRISF